MPMPADYHHPSFMANAENILVVVRNNSGGILVLKALTSDISTAMVNAKDSPRAIAMQECDAAIGRIQHLRSLLAKIVPIHYNTD